MLEGLGLLALEEAMRLVFSKIGDELVMRTSKRQYARIRHEQ